MSEELAGIALDVARAAAELVRGRAARGVAVADTKTSDTDVVTEADRASETLIRRLLRERRPDDAFLGEEGADEAGTSGVRWIVDPIDGTVNFLYGLPAYAVSIAAERDGEVVAGVVLNAVTGTEYVAHLGPDGAAGGGVATRDGIPIGVRAPAPLSHRLVATGFSYDPRAARAPGAGDGALPAPDPGHPPDRLERAGPVPRRRGRGRRLRRGGRQLLGPRGRRRWWPGSPGPAPS